MIPPPSVEQPWEHRNQWGSPGGHLQSMGIIPIRGTSTIHGIAMETSAICGDHPHSWDHHGTAANHQGAATLRPYTNPSIHYNPFLP